MGGAQAPGGQSLLGNYCTDFASYPGGLAGLRQMIEDADPSGLDDISYRWRAIHDALVQAQQDLHDHTLAATAHWSGSASDAFACRADELYQSLGNGAAYALNASSGISRAAAALRDAKGAMPPTPSELDMGLRFLTSEGSATQFDSDLASGMSRAAAIQKDGGQLSLLEERHQQAIVVMQQLEGEYEQSAAMIGEPKPSTITTNRGIYPPPPTTSHTTGTSTSGDSESARLTDETPAVPRDPSSVTLGHENGGSVGSPGGVRDPQGSAAGANGGAGGRLDGAGTQTGPAAGRRPGGTTPGSDRGPARDSGSGPGRDPLGLPDSELRAPARDRVRQSRVSERADPSESAGREGLPPEDATRGGACTTAEGTPASSAQTPETDASPTAHTQSADTATNSRDAQGNDQQHDGEMPFGPGGGGLRSGRTRRGRRRRRYLSEDDELFGPDGRPLGEELVGRDGINEWFERPAEQPGESFTRAGADLLRPVRRDDRESVYMPCGASAASRRRAQRPAARRSTGNESDGVIRANPPVIE